MPTLDPTISRDLSALRKRAVELPARIEDDAEHERIAALQSATHALVKSIDAWYKRHMDPISKALAALREEKKALLAEPESWLSRASALLSDYFLRKEREAARERERLQRQLDKEAASARKAEVRSLKREDPEAAAALASAPIVAPVAEVANTAALDGRSFRTDVDVVVLDLGLVPDEFVERSLRLAEVKRAWKAGQTSIPGLRLIEKRTLVNR